MLIPNDWELPDAIAKRLGKTTYGRQRAMVDEGHLLLVLHKVPGATQQRRDGVLFWRTPTGDWRSSTGGVGIEALKRLIEEYAAQGEELERKYLAADSATDHFEVLDHVVPVMRAARNAFRAIQSAREQCRDYVDLIEIRDLAYETERGLEILLEDTKNAMEFRTAREAERQASLGRQIATSSHRLNMLAAVFLPLTALTALMSMNVGENVYSRLEVYSELTFAAVFLGGALAGILLRSWISIGNKASPD